MEVAGLPGYWLVSEGCVSYLFKCIVYLDTMAIEAVDFCFNSLNSQCTMKRKKKKLWLKLCSWLWSWPDMVPKDLGSLRTVVKLKPAQSSGSNLKITALLKAVQGCTQRWSWMRDWTDFLCLWADSQNFYNYHVRRISKYINRSTIWLCTVTNCYKV